MSNGGKTVVFNTRERAISSDLNRLQDMGSRALGNLLQRRTRDTYNSTNVGSAVQNTGIVGGDTPLAADIHGGLMVQPNNPTSLFIQPGTIGLVVTDSPAGLDDSPYKLIDDPGVTSTGVLAFIAAGASTRIDVVECQVIDTVQETDNRDIFDPATGLFTPQLVNKVVEKRLNYRIRPGTPGAGYPGHSTGWLPLAIISVPSTATDFDDCVFWDVRPLVQDAVNGNGNAIDREYGGGICKSGLECESVSSQSRVFGTALREYQGYLAGGRVHNTNILQDELYLNLNLQDNRVGSEVEWVSVNTTVAIVALFPEGLPRWVKYTSTAGTRVPMSFRGILCAGDITNMTIDAWGRVSNVLPPASTGLDAVSGGVLVTSSKSAGSGSVLAINPFVMNEDEVWYFSPSLSNPSQSGSTIIWTVDPSSNTGDDAYYPANTKQVYYHIAADVQGNGGAQVEQRIQHSGSTILKALTQVEHTQHPARTNMRIAFWAELHPPRADGTIIPTDLDLLISIAPSGSAINGVSFAFGHGLRLRF